MTTATVLVPLSLLLTGIISYPYKYNEEKADHLCTADSGTGL